MKQYVAYTEHGNATIYATSLNDAWAQAYELFSDVSDVEFVKYL